MAKKDAKTQAAFDPDAAAQPGSGIFGLNFTRRNSRIVLLPVPFDATTSYGKGTANGPRAIFDASAQVDLFDLRSGRVYESGVWMEREDRRIRLSNTQATTLTKPIIAQGGPRPKDAARIAKVNAICERVNAIVSDHTRSVLNAGQIPGLIGGEHAMSFGAIEACASTHGEIGILQIDAHMDLRDSFEGFTWSHASIMHNVISRLPVVSRLVQIGIRDFGEGEVNFAKQHSDRVHPHFDQDWSDQLDDGIRFGNLVTAAIEPLPHKVYVSFDIDGLNPAMCPHTGTPVPGGLSFTQASRILDLLKASKRSIVGFDLVEVAPGSKHEPEWDANVGARVLYKLCGCATA